MSVYYNIIGEGKIMFCVESTKHFAHFVLTGDVASIYFQKYQKDKIFPVKGKFGEEDPFTGKVYRIGSIPVHPALAIKHFDDLYEELKELLPERDHELDPFNYFNVKFYQ